MNEEMRVEAMELCVTACEKHAASNEVCASTQSTLPVTTDDVYVYSTQPR